MLNVNQRIRVTKIFDSNKYALYNPTKGHNIMKISYQLLNVLKNLNGKGYSKKYVLDNKIISQSILNSLIESEILVETDYLIDNPNVLPELQYSYPLTSLVIELINICNLNCKHCYGKFGQPKELKAWKYSDIVQLKGDLDKLHTLEIRLSGGECLLNPDFEKIVMFFLENGFRVGIYTNAYDVKKIKHLLEITKGYHFYFAISLDGTKETHDRFRSGESFDKVIEAFELIKQYGNIEVMVETAISKMNLKEIDVIKEFVKRNYKEFEHKMFVISPINGCDCNLNYDDLLELRNNKGFLFEDYLQKGIEKWLPFKNKYRCMGGVINGTITADRKVRCCPMAQDDVFTMGYLTENSLVQIWTKPEGQSADFRNERIKKFEKCKSCKEKNKCGNKNCRVEANSLTGDWRNVNPYTCIAVKGYY